MQQINGGDKIVAAGDEGRIYLWTGKPWQWDKLSGPSSTVQLHVGSVSIFRLLKDNRLQRTTLDQFGNRVWVTIATIPDLLPLREPQITVGPRGNIYYLTEDRSEVYMRTGTTSWKRIGGPARKIQAGYAGLYALNPSRNQVFLYKPGSFSDHPEIPFSEGVWELAFSFDPGYIWESGREQVSLNVVSSLPPGDSRPPAGIDTPSDFESLWVKTPGIYPYQRGNQILRYETGKSRVTESYGVSMYRSRGEVASGRGSRTMVGFRPTEYVFELFRDPDHGTYDAAAFWPTAKLTARTSVKDFVDNGEEQMILGNDGFIYMDSEERP